MESFCARYCCRFCLTEKVDFQTVLWGWPKSDFTNKTRTQTIVKLFSQTQHYLICTLWSILAYWTLQYFNTTDYFSVDIMHDILEGVAQWGKTCYSIYKPTLTAKDVYGRVPSYSYGYTERRNRPPALKLDHGSNDLGLNAIQSWCLRNLTLIFGDLVQKDDKYWLTLLLLLLCFLLY